MSSSSFLTVVSRRKSKALVHLLISIVPLRRVCGKNLRSRRQKQSHELDDKKELRTPTVRPYDNTLLHKDTQKSML
ncbi:hypothetical protein SCHPADRAFT_344206 [Schizopora paradoxa]|uniref:Uncharacterized protein n=1 Tax=Schizopora paradoxa TaxID=27342 RepID=A0A0H2SAF2_9AGAM|nr:hypothetical protein SCHPADRAFT_344206 [Schizopora paradoxa]